MDVPVAYLSPPSRIVNQAIDMLGKPGMIIGDITDGTPVAETARRNYGQGLRQLLRTAHWTFARRQAPLQLLGDAVAGTALPLGVSSYVDQPWGYAYAWPTDAVQGRWLPFCPFNTTPSNPQGVPLTTGSSGVAAAVCYPLVPGRFLVSSSDQYPTQTGMTPWTQQPDLQRTEGLGPTFRKIILTNCCNAFFVYTRLVTTIEEWDDLFRQAFVTMLAMALLPVAVEDPKVRLAEYDRLAVRLRNAIAEARLASANEAGFVQTTNHTPSWITGRNSYGYGAFVGPGGNLYGSGYGCGDYWCGYDSLGWCGGVF